MFNFIIWDTKSWYFCTPPTRSFSGVLTSKNFNFFQFLSFGMRNDDAHVNTLFKLFLLLVVSGSRKTDHFVSCLFIWPKNFISPPCRDKKKKVEILALKLSWKFHGLCGFQFCFLLLSMVESKSNLFRLCWTYLSSKTISF